MSSDFENGVFADLYHPVEHKILSDYLDLEPFTPVEGVDTQSKPEREKDYICVEKDSSGKYSGISLQNAVARICLGHIQRRLPQWAEMHPGGRIVWGRTIRPRTDRVVVPMPKHLFTINWADSGPGISWPEAYHVTYLLGYHSHVVTASQDSADMYGYTEQAIGHFPAEGQDVIDKAGVIIQAYWRGQSEYQDPVGDVLAGRGLSRL